MLERKTRGGRQAQATVSPAVHVEPSGWTPVIDWRHCKGCGECVSVCPGNVLEVRGLDPGDYDALGWFARMKVRRHGLKVAYAVRLEDCQACGHCLEICPERAIRLRPNPS